MASGPRATDVALDVVSDALGLKLAIDTGGEPDELRGRLARLRGSVRDLAAAVDALPPPPERRERSA